MKNTNESPLRKCPRWMITAQGEELAEHGYKNQDSDKSLYHYVYSEGFLESSIGYLYLDREDTFLKMDANTNYFAAERLMVPIEYFTEEHTGAGIAFAMDGIGKNLNSAGKDTNTSFGIIIPEHVYAPLSKLVKIDHKKVVDLLLGIFPKDLVDIIGIKAKPKMQFKDCINRETVEIIK